MRCGPLAYHVEYDGITIKWPNEFECDERGVRDAYVGLMWYTKSKAWAFQGSNLDAGIRSFISRPIIKWGNRPRVIDMSGLEFSTGSKSDATSSVYEDESNYCSNAINTDE